MSSPILSMEKCTIRFGGLTAVSELDLCINENELVGLIGPNGAGKTTFFNLVSGAIRCSSGEITFKGLPTHDLPSHKIARLGIGRTFQIVRPFGELTVLENVLSGLGVQHCSNFFSSLGLSSRQKYRNKARELLHRTNLERYEDELAINLPLGLLRRLEIARALALNPTLLLLDESFSGLSHLEIKSLSEMVRGLGKDGVAVILIEHNMQVTMSLCERVAVLEHGRKIADGSPDEIRNNERVIAAYLGTEEHA